MTVLYYPRCVFQSRVSNAKVTFFFKAVMCSNGTNPQSRLSHPLQALHGQGR